MARARIAILLTFLAVPVAAADANLDALALDGPGRFLVAWDLVETRAPFAGSLDVGQSRTIVVDVADPNLVEFRAELRWRETHDKTGVTADDTFDVAIRSPYGADAAGRSASGTVSVDSGIVNSPPDPFEMDAEGISPVLDAVEERETRSGSGAWTVTVKLVDAGNPKGTKVDTANAYDLVVVARRYEPTVTRIVSLEPAPVSVADAAEAARSPWTWSAALLGVGAVGLGALTVRDVIRRRS